MLVSRRYENDGRATLGLSSTQKEARAELRTNLDAQRYQSSPRPCLICGSDQFTIVAEKDRYGIPMRTGCCVNCGMLQTIDQLRPQDYQDFYSTLYRRLYEPNNSPAALFRRQQSRGDQLLAVAGDNSIDLKGKRVVEVGCGAGGILDRFAAAGSEVRGYDFNNEYLQFGRDRGLDLRFGNAMEGETPGSCDVIVLSHVLEHMFDPLQGLRDLARMLAVGGHLLIIVPGFYNINLNSYGFDFLKYLQNAHLFHFDSELLRLLVRRAGMHCYFIDERIVAVCGPDDATEATLAIRPEKHDEVVAHLNKLEHQRERHKLQLLLQAGRKAARAEATRLARFALGKKGIALVKRAMQSARH